MKRAITWTGLSLWLLVGCSSGAGISELGSSDIESNTPTPAFGGDAGVTDTALSQPDKDTSSVVVDALALVGRLVVDLLLHIHLLLQFKLSVYVNVVVVHEAGSCLAAFL